MKKNIYRLLLLGSLPFLLCQCDIFDTDPPEPYTTYIRNVGGNGYDQIQDMLELDEGYLVAGTIGPQCDIVDGVIMLVDKESAAPIKIRTFGISDQSFEENFFSLIATQNGFKAVGFAIRKQPPGSSTALFCNNLGGNAQLFLGAVDENIDQFEGNYFQLDSTSWNSGFEIKELPNRDIIIAGSWGVRIAVMQLQGDSISKIIQSDTHIGNGFKILCHSTGRIFLTAEDYGTSNVYWAELDLAGNRLINERNFTFESIDPLWKTSLAHAIVETPDGNIMLAGTLTDGDFTTSNDGGFLLKTDLEGNQIFIKDLTLGRDDAILDMIPYEDGYIVVGKVNIEGTTIKTDALVAKIDQNGNYVWKEFHDLRENNEAINSVIPTSDGGLLLAGQTANGALGIQTNLLIKTDSEGKVER